MGYTPPFLDVRKVSGGWSVYGPSGTATDDLTIYPNTTTTTPYITILAGDTLKLATTASGKIQFLDNTTSLIEIQYGTPDIVLTCLNNKNLFLKTQGTGALKFGTYTGGAATDSTGYITILDAAGNTRKLMVQA